MNTLDIQTELSVILSRPTKIELTAGTGTRATIWPLPLSASRLLSLDNSLLLTPITALLFYDYFLTFEWEVSRYWARPNLSWATIFFFLNRYGTLLGNIPVVIQNFWTTPSTPEKSAV
jgi:hypothetical protein